MEHCAMEEPAKWMRDSAWNERRGDEWNKTTRWEEKAEQAMRHGAAITGTARVVSCVVSCVVWW